LDGREDEFVAAERAVGVLDLKGEGRGGKGEGRGGERGGEEGKGRRDAPASPTSPWKGPARTKTK
jgi:hypothetical protein